MVAGDRVGVADGEMNILPAHGLSGRANKLPGVVHPGRFIHDAREFERQAANGAAEVEAAGGVGELDWQKAVADDAAVKVERAGGSERVREKIASVAEVELEVLREVAPRFVRIHNATLFTKSVGLHGSISSVSRPSLCSQTPVTSISGVLCGANRMSSWVALRLSRNLPGPSAPPR